jgi:hypothetical protein
MPGNITAKSWREKRNAIMTGKMQGLVNDVKGMVVGEDGVDGENSFNKERRGTKIIKDSHEEKLIKDEKHIIRIAIQI